MIRSRTVHAHGLALAMIATVSAACSRPASAPRTPADDTQTPAAPALPPPSPAPAATSTESPPASPDGVPSVVLQQGSVSVNGRTVSSVVAGRVQRVDELHTVLARLAKQHRSSRDHRMRPPYPLAIGEGIDAGQAKSAIQTAAFAGWPMSVLELGGANAMIYAQVPAPSGGDWAVSPLWPDQPFVVALRADSVQVFRTRRDDSAASAPPAGNEEPAHLVVEAPLANVEALGKTLTAACPAPSGCSPFVLLVDDGVDFGKVKKVLGLFARRARGETEDVTLELRVQPPGPTNEPLRVHVGKTVNGRLPPAIIQQIVRASYDRLRKCYDAGVARDPRLEGKVVVRFVIDRKGHVVNLAAHDGTTLPEPYVSCMLDVYRTLVFPEPEGGIVTVVYPVMFSPKQ